jgi:hypothetical protein
VYGENRDWSQYYALLPKVGERFSFGSCSFSSLLPGKCFALITEVKHLNIKDEVDDVGTARCYCKCDIYLAAVHRGEYREGIDGKVALFIEEVAPEKKTDLVFEEWVNTGRTLIKIIIKKNGKEVFNESSWYKK